MFWNLDIIASFMTGYYEDGNLILRPVKCPSRLWGRVQVADALGSGLLGRSGSEQLSGRVVEGSLGEVPGLVWIHYML